MATKRSFSPSDEPDAIPAKRQRGGRNNGANAERERTRVRTLRTAFLELQRTLPTVPADTKLSKLDILVLATTYIAHLMKKLEGEVEEKWTPNYYHPMKKWPMRSRLYVGITSPDRAPVCDLADINTDNSSCENSPP